VLLDAVEQDRLCSTTVQRQVEHHVAAGATAQQIELVRIELDRLRLAVAAIDDSRKQAFATQLGDSLALQLAGLRGQFGAAHWAALDLEK